MKIIIYISIIAISVGLSLGIFTLTDKYQFGATLTTLVSTDQLSDFVAVYNANNSSLNNAIHWTSGSDYLTPSSSPTFGIILGDTSSSTIGKLIATNVTSTNATSSWLYISDSLTTAGVVTLQRASTTSFAITGITGLTQCLQVDTNGNVSGNAAACNSSGASWQYDADADAMITTSTKGFYMTASSTVHNSFRVDGNSTTTGSFYIGGDLFVNGDFKLTSYYTSSSAATIDGATEGTLMSKVIPGGTMDSNSILRARIKGRVGTSQLHWFAVRFGGEGIATSTTMSVDGTGFDAWVDIYNDNSTSAQDAFFTFMSSEKSAGGYESRQASTTALTIDTSVDQTFLVVGDNGSGTITVDALDIQLIK